MWEFHAGTVFLHHQEEKRTKCFPADDEMFEKCAIDGFERAGERIRMNLAEYLEKGVVK